MAFDDKFRLRSHEHTEFRYANVSDLGGIQQQRISDCLNYSGVVVNAKF